MYISFIYIYIYINYILKESDINLYWCVCVSEYAFIINLVNLFSIILLIKFSAAQKRNGLQLFVQCLRWFWFRKKKIESFHKHTHQKQFHCITIMKCSANSKTFCYFFSYWKYIVEEKKTHTYKKNKTLLKITTSKYSLFSSSSSSSSFFRVKLVATRSVTTILFLMRSEKKIEKESCWRH